jgi:hypothetical protein
MPRGFLGINPIPQPGRPQGKQSLSGKPDEWEDINVKRKNYYVQLTF